MGHCREELCQMSDQIRIEIPGYAAKVLDRLHELGYEAYVVGGCVRDSLLGTEPEDWDVTTNASPEKVRAAFPHTIDTGIEHGTVTVRMDGQSVEVTTYRIDGKYADHRHPDEVTFTESLEEDLKRRDFTINAMAYSEESGLIDLFGGQEDLRLRMVRCVGNARDRFTEDALRILRAVRFCAKLGFEMYPVTFEAARAMAQSLDMVSVERIQAELVKLLISPHPDKIRLAWECGITAVILPEFDKEMDCIQNNAHHRLTVGEHTVHTLMACPADKVLRLTMLLHDTGKPECQTLDKQGVYHYHGHAEPGAEIAERVLERLKFDKATERAVVHLVRCHSLYPELTDESVRRAIVQIGEDLFERFMAVKRSDIRGQSPEVQERKLIYMDELEEIYRRILRRGDCLSLKDLAVTGDDLIAAGMEKGPAIGAVLQKLLDEVLHDPELNRRDKLLLLAGGFAAETNK